MEVTCEQCKTKLNIPDEKIPKDQMVRVNCPKCKGKITLDTRRIALKKAAPDESEEETAETGKFHLKFIESKAGQKTKEEGYDYGDYSDDVALDFFEGGSKLALVMNNDTEHSEKIKTAVEEMGYKYIPSSNTRDAIGKMRFHNFDLILLSDGFDGQQLENGPILNYLNHVSMSVRRRIFLALMGDKFKTTDNMMAFAMSANIVINKKDVEKLSAILKRAISENEKFYKVFMDTLIETGKA